MNQTDKEFTERIRSRTDEKYDNALPPYKSDSIGPESARRLLSIIDAQAKRIEELEAMGKYTMKVQKLKLHPELFDDEAKPK